MCLTGLLMNLVAQKASQSANAYWRDGNITEAAKSLEESTHNDSANYLLMKIAFVKGEYSKALQHFHQQPVASMQYKDALNLAMEACVHLKDYKALSKLAKEMPDSDAGYFIHLAERPFTVIADKTYIIPFIDNSDQLNAFMPGIQGFVNGNKVQLRFDTGGGFLVAGKEAAAKLGIKEAFPYTGTHAAAKVAMWKGFADSVSFEGGPSFKNVPVVIVSDLKDEIIFGTNFLEQFLSTVDYPHKRFILTPRNMPALFSRHLAMLPKEEKALPFFLWSDHYLFAKGSFAGHQDLTFFFDCGLVAVTMINNNIKQASFTAARESLIKWGFDTTTMGKTTFLQTTDTLEAAGLKQPNTLIYFDHSLLYDRVFGGVRMDGLISHAWLQHYTWTLDFDKHLFLFGVPHE